MDLRQLKEYRSVLNTIQLDRTEFSPNLLLVRTGRLRRPAAQRCRWASTQ